MSSLSFDWRNFEWYRHPSGYKEDELIPVDGSKVGNQLVDYIVPNNPEEDLEPIRPFHENSGLFLEFASIDFNSDGDDEGRIAAFASTYGQLVTPELAVSNVYKEKMMRRSPDGRPHPNYFPGSANQFLPGRGVTFGVVKHHWLYEIASMSQAVGLWQRLLEKDHEGMEGFMQLHRPLPGQDAYFCHLWSEDFCAPHEGVYIYDAPDDEEELFELAGKCALVDYVNEFIYPSGYDNTAEMKAAIIGDLRKSPPRLAVQFSSLRMALWMQFALAICENRQYRPCESCGRQFEVSPETARTNRRTCSEACKSKSYRTRKSEAKKLAAQGMTPAKIAKELGSDKETVAGWLKAD